MRPSIGQISFANFPCVYDQRKTGYVVDMLDNETQLEYNNSAKLETTRQHLRRLLDGDQLTELLVLSINSKHYSILTLYFQQV